MMGHETRLGYIEGRLESFATKADIKDLEGKIAVSDQRTLTHVSEAIGKQTKWIVGAILVPLVVAIIGWSIVIVQLFKKITNAASGRPSCMGSPKLACNN